MNAFGGCTGLTSINIPNNVTAINMSVFNNCSGLTEINIPNGVTTIKSMAFSGCTGLKSIAIPNGVKTIQMNTCYGCTGLESVIIPSSAASIESGAFYGCTGLTAVISRNPSPPQINHTVFFGTGNNVCLYVPDGSIAAYASANSWKDFNCVKSIGEYEDAGAVAGALRATPAQRLKENN